VAEDVYDAFPVELGILEVQERGKRQTGDGKIADHRPAEFFILLVSGLFRAICG
jgi:hypothetical protein